MDDISHSTQRAVRRDRKAGFRPEFIALDRGLPLEDVERILNGSCPHASIGAESPESLRRTGLKMMHEAAHEKHPHDRAAAIRAVKGNFCDAPGCEHWREDV